ncbi:MAG: class I SAM-dependent methyltransferase [Gemmatimonadetes bacterium]|nr:class I SAM-dependent methyltransferase [Gemmatimonadota bacterium]
MKASDWNGYWKQAKGGRFTRVSWSKRRMERILRPHLASGMDVLDAGCGSGYFSAFFQGEGCRVTALDRSEEALAIAREVTGNAAAEYTTDDLLDTAFGAARRETFDLVFTDGLIEHFEPDVQRRLVANLIACLRPGGLLATFVPNLYSWWSLARPLVMPGIYEKPFRRAPLRALHEGDGLALVEEGGLSVFPFAVSPEFLAPRFGMIRYALARKAKKGARS